MKLSIFDIKLSRSKLLFMVTALALVLVLVFAVGHGYAQTPNPEGSVRAGVGSGGSSNGVTTALRAIANILSIVAGAIAVIFIIIGGFRYVTSSGDSSKVSGAKSAITYAVVGIVIVIFAQLIVNFALSESTTVPAPAPVGPGPI